MKQKSFIQISFSPHHFPSFVHTYKKIKLERLRGNKYGGAGRAFWIGRNDSYLDYVDVNLGLSLFDLSKFIH